MSIISGFIEALELGEEVTIDELSIFPVLRKGILRVSPLMDLDEAVDSGLFTVTEISEGGSVPELKVVNESDWRVIVFDGEELVGAKQNRVINITVIVRPNSTLIIPVSCVEQGRWSWHSRKFAASKAFMSPRMRGQKFSQVSASLERGAGFGSDQGAIWEEISSKAGRLGVDSRTRAMKDIFDRFHTSDSKLKKMVNHQEDQVGYLAFIRGGFAGGDIFSCKRLSERKFYKLMRSYHLDTLDESLEFSKIPVSKLFADLEASEVKKIKSPGAGSELRFLGSDIQGSAIVIDEEVAHLTILPKVSEQPKSRWWSL